MSAVGAEPWGQSQHVDHVSSNQARGLDAKKKTLGASERREEERAKWRGQMKEVDPTRLVIVDECGSTIALTPLYGWARHRTTRPWECATRVVGKNMTLLA